MRHHGLIAAAMACAALLFAAPVGAATQTSETKDVPSRTQTAQPSKKAPSVKSSKTAKTTKSSKKASPTKSSKKVKTTKAPAKKAQAAPSKAKRPTGKTRTAASAPRLRDVPTKIVSDRMTYEANNLNVTFSGNVHVTQDAVQLWSDRLVVRLHPAKPAKGKGGALVNGLNVGEIKSLLAEGAVRMRSDDRTGSCAKATYDVGKGLFTMSGDPTLQEPGRTLVGKEILYYVKEARSVVVGDKARRVEAVFLGPELKRKDIK